VLSARVRFLTVGVLAAIGVLIAGLRGPMAAAPVQAQTASEKKEPRDAGSNPSNKAFDLTYLPTDTKILVAIQPAALLARSELRPFLKWPEDMEGLAKALLLSPDEIDQLLMFWEGSPMGPAIPGTPTLIPPPSGYIVRSVKPQEWKQVFSRLALSTEEVQHAGQTYLRLTRKPLAGGPLSVYTPDDRTAVLAADDLLRVLIEDRKEPKSRHSWDEAWSQLARGQINAVLETRWLRRRLNQGEIQLDTVAPLLENVPAYALSINLDRELSADLVATVGEVPDVKPVTETLQALLTLGRNSVPSLREHAADAGRFRAANEWALGLFASLLDKARIEATGQMVHLRTSSRFDAASASRIISSFVGGAQVESTRFQSANNLKVVGLAFANYASMYGHLPPPVLYSGKTGKVPYSWRVALLPLLEQRELYSAYNFDEPWDGPSNSKLLDKMPPVYGYPGVLGTSKTLTAYFVFTGPQTMLGKGDKPSYADVTDGASNTILAVEAKRDVPWTKPEDIPFDPRLPVPPIGGFTQDGATVVFGDCSVRYLRKAIKSPEVMRALITPAGGEVINSEAF